MSKRHCCSEERGCAAPDCDYEGSCDCSCDCSRCGSPPSCCGGGPLHGHEPFCDVGVYHEEQRLADERTQLRARVAALEAERTRADDEIARRCGEFAEEHARQCKWSQARIEELEAALKQIALVSGEADDIGQALEQWDARGHYHALVEVIKAARAALPEWKAGGHP